MSFLRLTLRTCCRTWSRSTAVQKGSSYLPNFHRFISRFWNPWRLQSEAGYYLSSLVRLFYSSFEGLRREFTSWVDGCGFVYRDHGSYIVIQYYTRGV